MNADADVERALQEGVRHGLDVVNATGAVWLMRDAVDEPDLPPRPVPYRFTYES